ncbi:class I SAM-dependent methyltransferase [Sphingomonas sp.]|jgi:2-polyprenyl-3-methyl-5-hydroxy-6-metoxy-1,4-benzoquinol methylase|uniref:class I SAM-dependent methyltransferase n=1 Tax=Sphingomonas sp. TaxID=28214 RepID=UPI002E319503|nr:class I SAM-dependent methyltransferase [Sphingomonas sp.]HEX4695896.1 class I SAM-dependent methyltransferase [Sphingomonas sp.]
MTVPEPYPATRSLTQAVVAYWPQHATFVENSFRDREPASLAVAERLSECILKLAQDAPGGLQALCDDYRFLCEDIVLPEEIHFRRNGAYRLSNFDDANAECYANEPFMSRYMNGLLLSDVLWANHANAFAAFVNDFLPRLPEGARHLEIGPGHGLFLYFAASDPRVASISGWDISPASIEKTRHALDLLDAPRQPDLTLRDLFDASADRGDRFDSIVMSEILEHLEDPTAALRAAARHLEPGGLIFVNVPANSPAPDHIFLFHDVSHARQIMLDAGLDVLDSVAYPMSGATLDRAIRHKLSVSCVLTGRRPA